MVPRPGFDTSAVSSVTRSVPALTSVAARSPPFHRTIAPGPKFAPLTVTVTGPPLGILAGETASIRGALEIRGTGSARSHMLRPYVAARNVRLARCSLSDHTSTRGRPFERVDQFWPPSEDWKTPI